MNLGSTDSFKIIMTALKLLSNFNTDDEILHSLSIGLKGDANLELGNTSELHLTYELAAYKQTKNEFTTPYFFDETALYS